MTDTLPEPVGHLHSDGEFCQDRAVDAPVWWPVSLYTEDQVRAVRDAAVAAERARWSKLAAHVRCVEQADKVGALETRMVRMMARELDEVLGPNEAMAAASATAPT